MLQLLLTDHLVGSAIVIGKSNVEIILTLEGFEILTYLIILVSFLGYVVWVELFCRPKSLGFLDNLVVGAIIWVRGK